MLCGIWSTKATDKIKPLPRSPGPLTTILPLAPPRPALLNLYLLPLAPPSMRYLHHAVDPANSNPLEVHSSQGLTFPSGDSNRAASGIFDFIEGGEVSVPFKAAAATA